MKKNKLDLQQTSDDIEVDNALIRQNEEFEIVGETQDGDLIVDETPDTQSIESPFDHADLILQEAASHGLRTEVEMFAKKYITQGYKFIDAYQMAYAEWIK